MSSATFYKWRAKYGGMDASMMSRLKELEDENRRLKNGCRGGVTSRRTQGVHGKKVVEPSARREMAIVVLQGSQLSIHILPVVKSHQADGHKLSVAATMTI